MTPNEPQPLPPSRPTPQARRDYRDVCLAMASHADCPWEPVGFSEDEIRRIIADAGSTPAQFIEHWSALREEPHND